MSTATVNGAELFYEEAGSGLPCLVLPGGLGYDHTYMQSTLQRLEDVMRLVHYDHRGNGRSERVELETITIPQLAEDVDGMREHLGLDRVAVMGHSYGGFVALQYAVTHPDRISHLILLSTSPGRFEPTADELAERGDRSWITPEVEAALRSTSFPQTVEEFRAGLAAHAPVYVRTYPFDELAALLAACELDLPAMIRGFMVLPGWSVADRLDAITAPTLVVCGRDDLLTTPECSKRLSTAIPGAELLWLEEAGHFPWLEQPDVFFSGVKDWVARTTPDRSATRS